MSDKLLNTINGGYARLLPGDEQETTTINFNGTLKVVKDSKLWHATINAGGSLIPPSRTTSSTNTALTPTAWGA